MAREAVIIQNLGDANQASEASEASEAGEVGEVGEAADVARYSDAARLTIGTMWIIGGFLGALMFIIVPVVHLITTWALPLGGILLGLRAYKRRVVFYQVAGTCPACRESIELVGGSIDDADWQSCPKCGIALAVRAAAPQQNPSGANQRA